MNNDIPDIHCSCGAILQVKALGTWSLGDPFVCPYCGTTHRLVKAGEDIIVREVTNVGG